MEKRYKMKKKLILNKGIYEGEVNKKDLPHGTGTFIFADGEKYVGEWKDGNLES